MSTYVIGDVHGCFEELQSLLQLINFNSQNDVLWFTGDLVNRGPHSLEVLRFLFKLPRVICVLGNHDLTLLALAYTKQTIKHHTLDKILTAPDKNQLLDWLRQQPLLYEDPQFNCILVHAGIPPQWKIRDAKYYADEVSAYLNSEDYISLLENMFGNLPNQWNPLLTKWEKFRFTINALTRIRFCDKEGTYDLSCKEKLESAPAHLIPWFEFPIRKQENRTILFGHWAALEGKINNKNLVAMDTGCYWGGQLTALCLESNQLFHVSCKRTLSSSSQ